MPSPSGIPFALSRGMEAVSHEAATRRRSVGRPSTVESYSSRIAEWLSAEPQLSAAELLRRLQTEGYAGGKSALYELVRRLRPARVAAASIESRAPSHPA